MMDVTNAKIAIIGLGYVGLQLAAEFGKKHTVVGFDINLSRIQELKKGKDSTLETTSQELKEAVNLNGGSSEAGRNIVVTITKKQLEEIAKNKMEDLNAHDLSEAVKIIAGSARSMGIEVKE